MNLKSSYRRMILGLAFGSLGASLTWTGLPILFANESGDARGGVVLFLTSTIASILVSLVGGHLADRFSRKKIALLASGIEVALLVGFFIAIENITWFTILGFSLTLSLLGSFGGIATEAWFGQLAEKVESALDVGLGRRNTYLMIAKMIGMGAGPLVYTQFGRYALLIDAGLAAATWFCLVGVDSIQAAAKAVGEKAVNYVTVFQSIMRDSQLRQLLLLLVVSALFSYPLVSSGILALQKAFHTNAYHFSMFWIMGSVGSLCGNFLTSQGLTHKFNRSRVFTFFIALQFIGIVIMSFSSHPIVFNLAFGLVTIANPIINNLSFAKLFQSVDEQSKGKIVAVDDFLSDSAILIAVSAMMIFESAIVMPMFLLIFTPFIALRLFLSLKVFHMPTVALENSEAVST